MIIPDQIEAGTFMISAAATGGRVMVKNIIPKHMDSLTHKLMEMGVAVTEHDDALEVNARNPLKPVHVKTMVYPGFPTDLQPQMTALMSSIDGTSMLTENIFENRFQYVNQLRRLGANIVVEGKIAIIDGNVVLTGAEVSATDLRAGAALIVAGLAAEGRTTIGNIKYIYRGYENVVAKLRKLGAEICLIDYVEGDADDKIFSIAAAVNV
jgi:UDP-N-acetylglucosamine 1-carboxyvinyltransferase